jgi:hypothetical protein
MASSEVSDGDVILMERTDGRRARRRRVEMECIVGGGGGGGCWVGGGGGGANECVVYVGRWM